MQDILAILIVAIAAGFLVRRLAALRASRRRCGSCSSCSAERRSVRWLPFRRYVSRKAQRRESSINDRRPLRLSVFA